MPAASDEPLHELSIAEAGRRLRAGALSSLRLTEHSLARIDRLDPQLHAFVVVARERALADAAAADEAFAQGRDLGPFQGIPFALKDIYDFVGFPTTCHSKLRLDYAPRESSAAAARIATQGGVFLGKLATHEFALGGPSFDLPFPPARNPWNTDHITGGSSSGSGAAVAAGFVRMAMGSDTGGSIRGPASYCGTVGLKPTYGRVSRRGVFPLSYSLDHCGPLAWTVEDVAVTMRTIAGFDADDPASAQVPVPDYLERFREGVHGLRIGVPRAFYRAHPELSPETARAIEDAAQAFARLGATVEEVELPDYDLFVACGRVIMFAEAFAIHERDFRERPLDFGKNTFMRMALGAFVTAADLTQAMRLRGKLARAVNRVLERYDLLITASTVAPAPKFGAGPSPLWSGPTQNSPFNVTGNPAMAIPTGFSREGLPLSMQIVGRAFDEATVLRAGYAFEAQRPRLGERPTIAA